MGSAAVLFTILVVVFTPVFSSKESIVKEWQVVGIVAAFVIPIACYGAFIFDRALKISAKIDKEEVGLSTDTESKEAV